MNALLLAVLAATSTPDAGKEDVIFNVLEAEVGRAMTLQMPASKDGKVSQKPYFAYGTVVEEDGFRAVASFGALTQRGSGAKLDVQGRVRVGSMVFDSGSFRGGYGGRSTPAELDADVLRVTLWQRFDGAYKGSLEELARKQAFVETTQLTEKIDDFSKAKTTSVVGPKSVLVVDKDVWTQRVRDASAAFLAQPELIEGTARFEASVSTQSFFSSEKAKHRFGDGLAFVELAAQAQAADGANIRLTKLFSGRAASDLPDTATLLAEAKTLGAKTVALAKTEVPKEDYTGPVLFTGQAASIFFLQTIGEPLSNPRDDLGSRVSGRLIDRMGKHIATKFLDARDDPTQKSVRIDGKDISLWGSYPVDDDSVAPQPLSLVEAGVLKTYFMSRIPTSKLKETNGHCRGEQGAVANLFIESKEKTTRADLKKRLIELAKEEDSDFGLLVEQMNEYVYRPYGGQPMPLPQPLVMTKVFLDGHEVPVRGLAFKPVGPRVLKDIVAMGDTQSVLNLRHRGQPTSVVAPDVLVRLLELQRMKEENEKPPALKRP